MALDLSKLDGTDGFRLDGTGSSVAGAGDVNGDGIADLIVGTPSYDSTGASFVVFGTSTSFSASFDLAGLDGTNGFRLDGVEALGRTDRSVAGAGDVNGDGIGDLIVGAPSTGEYTEGASYVVFGTRAGFAASLDLAGLDGSNGFRLHGYYHDLSGFSVAGAGDVNGDGFDDLIVGAPHYNPTRLYFDPGTSYVIFGAADGFAASLDLAALDGSTGFRLGSGHYDDDSNGFSVAGAGDVNGDGFDEVIVGVPGSANYYGYYTSAGESYVVFGSGAGFPAGLDRTALDGSNGFRIGGVQSYDRSCFSVAGAGDVNGDGFDDLIVGAPKAESRYYDYAAGESYVVFGSGAGFAASLNLAALDGSNGFRLNGVYADRSGFSVAGAGDVNGDGIDDLIVGAPGRDYSSYGISSAGATYVIFGTNAGFPASFDLSALDGSIGFRVDGTDASDYSGFSVAGAGDVNGDGIDDLIVGAPGAGGSYVIFGTTRLGGANDAPVAADDDLHLGSLAVVELASDNGAGSDHDPDFDDLTISGINGVSLAIGGSVTLASGLRVTAVAATEIRFDAPGVALGTELSDSFVYEVSDGHGESDTAIVSVSYQQNAVDLAALDGSDGFRLEGIEGHNVLVAGAGDINGDGVDDLIIGASVGYYGDGTSYVVFGTSAGSAASVDVAALDGANGFRLNGSGGPVAGAGDVNGDGIDDLIVGADVVDASFVVFGTRDGFPASLDLASLDGTDGFRLGGVNSAGASVAGAGDVDDDGLDDLIIGAPSASYAGESYVAFGSSAGFAASLDLSALDGTNGFRLNGIDAYGASGFSVAGAGDVNGDGIDDVIIGAPHAGGTGESYVVFGSSAGFAASLDLSALDGENGFRIDGTADGSGVSVAGAGDVNGDGIDDLIIGSPGSFANKYESASYIVFGTGTGFAASLDLAALDGANGFRLTGINRNDRSGSSVAGAATSTATASTTLLLVRQVLATPIRARVTLSSAAEAASRLPSISRCLQTAYVWTGSTPATR